MAQGRTIVAGASFGIGLFFGLIALLGITQPKATPEQQFGSIGIGLLGGVPSVALGTWLLMQNRDRRTQEERDRIQGIFYKLLKESNGQINVLRFSMEAGITGTEARVFLDERAKEFNAAFNVTEEGKIFYYFDGDFNALAAPAPAPAQTYDVVLEAFPGRNRVSVLNVLNYQNNLPRPVAKALLKQGRSHPVTIAQDVTEQQANHLRQQLEACGATVLIIPKG